MSEQELVPDETRIDVENTTSKQRKGKKLGGITGKGFMPGQSGNPAGKPPGSISLVQMIKDRLQQVGPDQKRIVAEHFIDNVIQDALDGNETSRKLIFNYVEGMPKQQMQVDVDKDTISELTSFFRLMANFNDQAGQNSVRDSEEDIQK